MVASVLILVFCAGLFLYWFRYTCIMLVRDGSEEMEANSAGQSSFNFQEIQERAGSGAQLDPLRAALQRDYEVLDYLVRHASGLALESFEERMLVWDYRLLRVWYNLTRTAAPEQARAALREMASVLCILAGRIGQRAGVQSRA